VKFNWRIGGEAGKGIINIGQIFAKACLRDGLKVFSYAEYPSLIRGGHNYLNVSVSDENVYSHSSKVDLLLALDKETIVKHNKSSSAVLCDVSLSKITKGKCYAIPMQEIAKDLGNVLYQNIVAIGATLGLVGLDLKQLDKLLKETFSHKDKNVINANLKAAKAGWDYAKENFKFDIKISPAKKEDRIFISGNDAIVAGAINAGCKFISAYPMTPATSILTGMAKYSRDYNIVVKHTEDELASINMAIGAGFTGVRSMTCTSGGGFALMSEGLGLAAQTETPVVIAVSQRPGPATGLATRSGQGDLQFALHSSQDSFPRVVIAPGDVNECFYLTQQAFNIAEKYQIPVVILVDKFLSTAHSSVHNFSMNLFSKRIKIERGKIATGSAKYKRYLITKDGISPRTLPGTKNGEFVASSYEHDEHGAECEDKENKIDMTDKRYKKFEVLAKELSDPKLFGNSNNVVVSWGSTKGVVRESRKICKKDFAHIHLSFISPFPTKFFNKLSKKNLIVVEGNKTSQLSDLIRKETGIEIKHKILRYDGRPFDPENLAKEVSKLI